MRFIFASICALTSIAFTISALAGLPPSTGPVSAHSPAHFWLTATSIANPSDYGGRGGTGFYVNYTQTKPVYVTLDAPITVSDRMHFTTHATQPVARYDDHLELRIASVPPSKDPILCTTKVAQATSHCTQFQPPQK